MSNPKPFNAGKGRPKGVPNKITRSVKDALIEAFDQKGGVPALVAWASEDPTAFYGLWGRLAPRELIADVSISLSPEERQRRIAALFKTQPLIGAPLSDD